uniref:Uncharacterized protein n=1 Tax=Anguilla anguilla TaxID=7936 RepID=A0A0E9P7J5_ANGAN
MRMLILADRPSQIKKSNQGLFAICPVTIQHASRCQLENKCLDYVGE